MLLSIVALVIGVIKPSLVKQSSRKRSLIVFGSATVIFFILFGATSNEKGKVITSTSTVTSSEKPISDRKVISTVYAEKVIKDTLKAPSTAKFVDVQAYELSNEKDVWAVNGYVDSQNSFGAMIRNQWEVQLDYRDGKGGTIKSILFDGKKIQ